MEDLEEKELIKRCIRGDRTSQAALFNKYKDTLYFISLKYCRNEVEAEDNLHDAFIDIFNSIKKYRNEGSFEGWMKRITMYKAIEKYKSKKMYTTEINDDLFEDFHESNTDIATIPLKKLLKCIQQLPDQYRFVFNLYQLDGYSHKEVAAVLNISENTSKSNYHRAKLLLRKKLAPLLPSQSRKQ